MQVATIMHFCLYYCARCAFLSGLPHRPCVAAAAVHHPPFSLHGILPAWISFHFSHEDCTFPCSPHLTCFTVHPVPLYCHHISGLSSGNSDQYRHALVFAEPLLLSSAHRNGCGATGDRVASLPYCFFQTGPLQADHSSQVQSHDRQYQLPLFETALLALPANPLF